MSEALKVTGSLLARNTLLNLLGQVVPLGVGIIAMPYIVRGLGTERFGILSLSWIILGYFAIFDIGWGRATTKLLAELLGKGEESQIPSLVWTSVMLQMFLGILGSFILYSITPLLAERILNISSELIKEARETVYVLSFSLPVILVSSSFRSALEAMQRFDLINAVKIPLMCLMFILPLLGLFFGLHLPGIVVLIVVSRLAALVIFIIMNFQIFPGLKRYSICYNFFLHLFSFGKWVTISSVVGPILVYLDRFLISSLISMAALAYYTAPYEAVTRLLVIPASLVMSLFPAFSTLERDKNRQRLEVIFTRSLKYIFTVLGPMVIAIMLFSKEILKVWLGPDFSLQSALVLQILAIGVLINSLAHIPFSLLQAVGRPDLPAKFYVFEFPFHLTIALFLIKNWGINGAALSWTLRVALDAFLLFVVTFKIYQFAPHSLMRNGTIFAFFVFLTFAGIASGVKFLINVFPLGIQFLFFVVLVSLFSWVVWKKVMDVSDREIIIRGVKPWQKPTTML